MTDLPPDLPGYGALRPYRPAGVTRGPRMTKLLADLDAAISACDLRDGATVSFHHHLRNGDAVLNMVMAALARRGLKDLHVAASSLFPVHAPLVDHIRNGTVSRISAAFISGPVGEAISTGVLPLPAILMTHGGRARALDAGDFVIDAAFVAAPVADEMGNVSGSMGTTACGTLGYPMTDVAVARRTVAITDTLVPYPAPAIDIPQGQVDHVVQVPRIGDPSGIASGTTRPAEDPVSLAIADSAARTIAASGLLNDGFSFQTGAGGASLATAAAVGRQMAERGVTGSFCSGGITGFHVEMLRAGLFRGLLDVQCFDLEAVRSYRDDPRHQAMSAATYAAPHIGGAVVDRVDAVVLGAAEVDLEFNVNVTTRAGGVLIGGSGGHADTAAGAQLSIVTTRLTAAGFAKIVPQVGTLTTPGQTIDVVVTEAGLAVNPARTELAERLHSAGLRLRPIEVLAREAATAARQPVPPRAGGRVVAISEYRDGSVTDLVRQIGTD
ncbi:citrate lyase subunit alpha / citrate CoA-transferase [Mameliella alba]|uniref:citrate lyase subunit alpha n=1 Tax=Mameliella alba TaxID=561184 RepID=UPI0008919FF1|nr:citrate lyase subunit alpha [Mameliella alba]OWV41210.1 citrate lyase subunit alpha [Mameliella alba]PTR34648.1 citrate lyase subunit alpha/citrate CoA-transferase [Mameliella alba]GGF84272.1 citrate lyase subunit alpha [Mameliella alba]SDE25120.1 citrate lyase subunit alpha / citrate CoA-transferase [Mameliella alba]